MHQFHSYAATQRWPYRTEAITRESQRILVVCNHGESSVDTGLEAFFEIRIAGVEELNNKQLKYPFPVLIVFILNQLRDAEIKLIKQLKANHTTALLPIVGVLNQLTNTKHIKCINAGMDLVFSDEVERTVLQASVKALVSERTRLKRIYQEKQATEIKAGEYSFDEVFMQRARNVILDNYTNPTFNITQFVRYMNVSRTNLYIKIKELTNQTTSEFVRSIRLEEAARLLKEGELNVSEVAFKVGFKDPKYLSKKFKLRYGITPSDFRKGNMKLI